jgi:hypothetical protein
VASPLLDLPLVALAGVAVLLAVRWARTRRRRQRLGHRLGYGAKAPASVRQLALPVMPP